MHGIKCKGAYSSAVQCIALKWSIVQCSPIFCSALQCNVIQVSADFNAKPPLNYLDSFGIGATIRTRREIQCLPYAGFLTCRILIPMVLQNIFQICLKFIPDWLLDGRLSDFDYIFIVHEKNWIIQNNLLSNIGLPSGFIS